MASYLFAVDMYKVETKSDHTKVVFVIEKTNSEMFEARIVVKKGAIDAITTIKIIDEKTKIASYMYQVSCNDNYIVLNISEQDALLLERLIF